MTSDHPIPAGRWPQLLPQWATADAILGGWRERLARVSEEESAHISNLPYVRGVAVIGSVGRGNPWPISDVDMLVMADRWRGRDPEHVLREVEAQRNERILAAGIINEVEASEWVVDSSDVAAASEEDDEAFLRRMAHPHWLGIAYKCPGARVVSDVDGVLSRFVRRCEHSLFEHTFRRHWLRMIIDEAVRDIAAAEGSVGRGEWAAASVTLLRTAQALTCGFYAKWRTLPQSISRGVSRFLCAARKAGEDEIGRRFLTASRLLDDDVWRRFDSLLPDGKRERDLWLAVRHGSGEDIGESMATRDFVQVNSWIAWRDAAYEPYPEWTGVTAYEEAVRSQLEATQELLSCLRVAEREAAK